MLMRHLGRRLLSGRFRDLLLFSLTSGIGWLVDVSLFTWLVFLKISPFYANLISAGIAVSYVFFVSTRHIFIRDQRYMVGKFLGYLVYHIVAVFLASAAIQGLYGILEVHPLICKIIVTPFTLYINYIFMAFLLEKRLRWY